MPEIETKPCSRPVALKSGPGRQFFIEIQKKKKGVQNDSKM